MIGIDWKSPQNTRFPTLPSRTRQTIGLTDVAPPKDGGCGGAQPQRMDCNPTHRELPEPFNHSTIQLFNYSTIQLFNYSTIQPSHYTLSFLKKSLELIGNHWKTPVKRPRRLVCLPQRAAAVSRRGTSRSASSATGMSGPPKPFCRLAPGFRPYRFDPL